MYRGLIQWKQKNEDEITKHQEYISRSEIEITRRKKWIVMLEDMIKKIKK